MSPIPDTEHLREEFNRWAEAGRGDDMEQHHLPIVEPMLALIEFKISNKKARCCFTAPNPCLL